MRNSEDLDRILMKITFYGATQTVTGSKYVIESEGYRLLLDCGMYQGKRDVSNALNKTFPFDASSIDAMILSHAHTDHCGLIPILIKNGFSGKIYCTAPTADIAKFILEDAASIQEQDALYFNKHLPAGQKPIEPLYTKQDVKKSFSYFAPVPYFRLTQQWTQLAPNIRFKFYDAGHILGSAVTLLEITEAGEIKRLVFTGDLGRHFLPILRDPEFVEEPAETLIMECTYGNRLHRPVTDLEGDLKNIINEAIKNKSKIIVPTFSLGRTQELLYMIHKLIDAKEISRLPIFIDSPLAQKITRVFGTYTADFDEEFWNDFGERGESAFLFRNLITTVSIEESKSINNKEGPYIVIAGSGMCEGGRVLHHLKNNIENPNSIILITGYQAQHTLGRKIVEISKAQVHPVKSAPPVGGAVSSEVGQFDRVKIYGQEYHVKAKVISLDELSAHADQKDLLSYALHIKNLKNVFLIHTEMPEAEAFSSLLKKEAPSLSVNIPSQGQEFEI